MFDSCFQHLSFSDSVTVCIIGKTLPPRPAAHRGSVWFAGEQTSSFLPFRLFQVTQVLVGHVLLPALVHLLRCEPFHSIQDRCSPETICTRGNFLQSSKNSSKCNKTVDVSECSADDQKFILFHNSCVCTSELLSNEEKVSTGCQVSPELHILRCFTHKETTSEHLSSASLWVDCMMRAGLCLEMAHVFTVKTKNHAGAIPVRLHSGAVIPPTQVSFPQKIMERGMGTGWGRRIQRGPYLASCHI